LNDAGSTILLITHDTQLARQASRVVHIDDGHLSEAMTNSSIHMIKPNSQQGVSP